MALLEMQKPLSQEDRCEGLWSRMVHPNCKSFRRGYHLAGSQILVIDYEDLVRQPEAEIARIYRFLDLPPFGHLYSGIKLINEEDEEKSGIRGLHYVRGTVEKISPPARQVLDSKIFSFFSAPHLHFFGKCRRWGSRRLGDLSLMICPDE